MTTTGKECTLPGICWIEIGVQSICSLKGLLNHFIQEGIIRKSLAVRVAVRSTALGQWLKGPGRGMGVNFSS